VEFVVRWGVGGLVGDDKATTVCCLCITAPPTLQTTAGIELPITHDTTAPKQPCPLPKKHHHTSPHTTTTTHLHPRHSDREVSQCEVLVEEVRMHVLRIQQAGATQRDVLNGQKRGEGQLRLDWVGRQRGGGWWGWYVSTCCARCRTTKHDEPTRGPPIETAPMWSRPHQRTSAMTPCSVGLSTLTISSSMAVVRLGHSSRTIRLIITHWWWWLRWLCGAEASRWGWFRLRAQLHGPGSAHGGADDSTPTQLHTHRRRLPLHHRSPRPHTPNRHWYPAPQPDSQTKARVRGGARRGPHPPTYPIIVGPARPLRRERDQRAHLLVDVGHRRRADVLVAVGRLCDELVALGAVAGKDGGADLRARFGGPGASIGGWGCCGGNGLEACAADELRQRASATWMDGGRCFCCAALQQQCTPKPSVPPPRLLAHRHARAGTERSSNQRSEDHLDALRAPKRRAASAKAQPGVIHDSLCCERVFLCGVQLI